LGSSLTLSIKLLFSLQLLSLLLFFVAAAAFSQRR
jgi:hypothetical protein